MVKIVLLEDDMNLALVIKKRLQNAGHDVMHIHDPNDVNENITRDDIDIVVTDMMMPGITGTDVLVNLSLTNNPPKVVAMSASSTHLETAKTFGATEIFQKPFNMVDFLDRIKELAIN